VSVVILATAAIVVAGYYFGYYLRRKHYKDEKEKEIEMKTAEVIENSVDSKNFIVTSTVNSSSVESI